MQRGQQMSGFFSQCQKPSHQKYPLVDPYEAKAIVDQRYRMCSSIHDTMLNIKINYDLIRRLLPLGGSEGNLDGVPVGGSGG